MRVRDTKGKKGGKGLMNRRSRRDGGDLHEGEREFIVALTKITCVANACQIRALA